ncbi:MAG: glycosyltransferase, partial [Verrucomicrobiota bacterium]
MNPPPLSIIIPCWEDARALRGILQSLQKLDSPAEIIVADASVTDTCRMIAEEAGAKVACCPRPNRGAQMNAGAGMASGAMLLFQHADTELTQSHLESLNRVMRDPTMIGGAFHRRFDGRHAHLAWLEEVARFLNERGSTLY